MVDGAPRPHGRRDEECENKDVEPAYGSLFNGHWSLRQYRVHSSVVSSVPKCPNDEYILNGLSYLDDQYQVGGCCCGVLSRQRSPTCISLVRCPMEISSARHQFPPDIIRHAVWLYLRFTLSFRDVEDLLAELGLDVSYETIRRWVLKFGPLFAKELRRRRH